MCKSEKLQTYCVLCVCVCVCVCVNSNNNVRASIDIYARSDFERMGYQMDQVQAGANGNLHSAPLSAGPYMGHPSSNVFDASMKCADSHR